jgi:preprotein translocase subunit SecA
MTLIQTYSTLLNSIYQITCGQNILINRTEVAGSNVTEEGLDLMQIYKAVIAARNNVREARNGLSVEMKGIMITGFCSRGVKFLVQKLK